MKNEFSWVSDFEQRHGRKPRILHIGNIANNAYKNAKILREAGVESDVLCYNYFHIMGTPEWEDAEISNFADDHFHPTWYRYDLKGFVRPRWFIQGYLEDCAEYIRAKFEGDKVEADRTWRRLCQQVRINFPGQTSRWQSYRRSVWDRFFIAYQRSWLKRVYSICNTLLFCRQTPAELGAKIQRRVQGLGGNANGLMVSAFSAIYTRWYLLIIGTPTSQSQNGLIKERFSDLSARFRTLFPKRNDQLREADIDHELIMATKVFKEIFSYYDLVQCYATEPIYALLTGKHPYLAFEHGTLRHFTQGDCGLNRLTSMAYREADHVFITNGDCLEYARKLDLGRYSPMLHPLDVNKIRTLAKDDGWVDRFGGKAIFICPLRHDPIKGADLYIKALPKLRADFGNTFVVVMTEWGEELSKSKILAKKLGVDDLIAWVEPLPKVQLFKAIKACSAVLDQTVLHCFGATAPEAIACGTPVLMSYDPKTTEWILPEPAPILPAFSEDDIVQSLKKAMDPEWRRDYEKRAKDWIDRCHSDEWVAAEHIKVYQRLLQEKPALKDGRRSTDAGLQSSQTFTESSLGK